MRLIRLKVGDVRNIAHADLKFSAGLNIFVGPNASGKTSLLEALHLLGTGKSFRTARREPIIRYGTQCATVFGIVQSERTRRLSRIGIRKETSETGFRLDGQASNAGELARRLPLQVVDCEADRLLNHGPAERRRLLDWGLFHVEPAFLGLWRRYLRLLKQRNALLRDSDISCLSSWEKELSEIGEKIDERRQAYVRELEPILLAAVEDLLGSSSLTLEYNKGWRADATLLSALQTRRERDRRLGYTSVGIHRSDLVLKWSGQAARDALSRGQQKMLIFAVRMAQSEHFARNIGESCVLVVDDLAAELDEAHRSRLWERFLRAQAQIFVTLNDAALLPSRSRIQGELFHVEHGVIKEML